MSIATRISSMEEHIKESYQELKGIGLDITGFNKNLENIPKVIDNYWETLPKVSGNGTDITLDNTKEGKMKIELKGDISQDTTTGTNYFNAKGITSNNFVVNEDGSKITLTIAQSQGEIYTPSGKKFKALCPEIQVGDVVYIYFTCLIANDTIYTTDGTYWANGGSKTITQDILDATVVFYRNNVSQGETFANVYSNLRVVKVRYAEFEAYSGGTIAPNPSFPMPIKVVTGGQNIKITSKNYVIDTTWTDGKFLNSSDEEGTNVGWAYSDYIDIENIKYYQTGSFTGSLPKTILYNASKQKIASLDLFTANNLYDLSTYNAKYIRLSSTVGQKNTNKLYKEQNYEINLGKNLFDKENASIVQGYINVGDKRIYSADNRKILYIPCKSNTYYTVSKQGVYFRLASTAEIPANNTAAIKAINIDNTNVATFNTGSDVKYLCVSYYNSSLDTLTEQQILNSIQIEEGTQATTYSSYFTPIELCKIGTYQDYIYKSGANWYKHKEIAKLVLDGTNYSFSGYFGNNNRGTIQISELKSVSYSTKISFCSHFSFNSSVYLDSQDDVGYCSRNNSGGIYVRFGSTSEVNTLAKANTWLSNNQPILYSVLATPTDEPITEPTLIEQLNNFYYASSYEEQTNINSRGILATDMNANALEDLSN